jgi:hypothetical protein
MSPGKSGRQHRAAGTTKMHKDSIAAEVLAGLRRPFLGLPEGRDFSGADLY